MIILVMSIYTYTFMCALFVVKGQVLLDLDFSAAHIKFKP